MLLQHRSYKPVQLLALLPHGHNICVLLHTWLCCLIAGLPSSSICLFQCQVMCDALPTAGRRRIMSSLVPPKIYIK